MSRGGIIIQNKTDGRGMMLPEREGKGTFNRLPFISMAHQKQEIGYNTSSNKIIIKSKKLTKKIEENRKKELENKLYPSENYRKLKTSEQFWKKNENPIYKNYNKNNETQTINVTESENQTILKEKSSNILNHNTLSNTKAPQKLRPIAIKKNLKNKLIDEKKNDDIKNNNNENKIQKKETQEKIHKNALSEIINDEQNEKSNKNKNNNNKVNEEEKKEIKEEKEKKEEKEEKEKKEEKEEKEEKDSNEVKEEKEIKESKDENNTKDPLQEDEMDENENIDEVLKYLNGLDFDKYCKDMEIREALTLLKNKMEKEQEEKENEEEKNKNKVIIEGAEQNEQKDGQKEDEDEKSEKKDEEENKDNNKLILPEINSKIPEQNTVEIVDEEEKKRKEEIKKYKIAEQIAKTEQMKAVHSTNSIMKLLQREGLNKIEEIAPLKISVIKENPIANSDGYIPNKLPFLHSLPLV